MNYRRQLLTSDSWRQKLHETAKNKQNWQKECEINNSSPKDTSTTNHQQMAKVEVKARISKVKEIYFCGEKTQNAKNVTLVIYFSSEISNIWVCKQME